MCTSASGSDAHDAFTSPGLHLNVSLPPLSPVRLTVMLVAWDRRKSSACITTTCRPGAGLRRSVPAGRQLGSSDRAKASSPRPPPFTFSHLSTRAPFVSRTLAQRLHLKTLKPPVSGRRIKGTAAPPSTCSVVRPAMSVVPNFRFCAP